MNVSLLNLVAVAGLQSPYLAISSAHRRDSLAAINVHFTKFAHPFLYASAPIRALVRDSSFRRFSKSPILVEGEGPTLPDGITTLMTERTVSENPDDGLTLENTFFYLCKAEGTNRGGAIRYTSSGNNSVVVNACSFYNCSAGGNGGCISVAESQSWIIQDGHVTLTKCCFVGAVSAGNGPVCELYSVKVIFSDITVLGCETSSSSSAFLFQLGSNCVISENVNLTSSQDTSDLGVCTSDWVQLYGATFQYHLASGFRANQMYDVLLQKGPMTAENIDVTDHEIIGDSGSIFRARHNQGSNTVTLNNCNVFHVKGSGKFYTTEGSNTVTGSNCKTDRQDLIPDGSSFITQTAEFTPNSNSGSNEGYCYYGEPPTTELEEPTPTDPLETDEMLGTDSLEPGESDQGELPETETDEEKTSGGNNKDDSDGDGLSPGAIAGIAIGAIVIVAAIVAVVVVLVICRKSKNDTDSGDKEMYDEDAVIASEMTVTTYEDPVQESASHSNALFTPAEEINEFSSIFEEAFGKDT